jgi:hypothetical protein
MKTHLTRLLLVSALVLGVAVPTSLAQRSLGKKKGPTSKIFVAESTGDSQIQSGEKIYTARQSTAFDAPGTVIETKANSHNAIVYSNGTGMFVDENTRVEIGRFVQEPFQPDRDATLDQPYEPSVSQSNVYVPHGAIGICTSRLVSGSSMLYSTPHGSVNIRGGKVSIESHANETYIDLLEGDVTVRSSGKDVGGQILRPGERAIIQPPAGPGLEPTITIQPIPKESLKVADERTEMACNAKKTVTFEAIDRPAGQEGAAPSTPGDEAAGADAPDQDIVAKPTVPSQPPTNVVVSPDRLPGT